MADVVMIVTIVAFVLLCVAYVGWCDRIIERDDTTDEHVEATAREEVAA